MGKRLLSDCELREMLGQSQEFLNERHARAQQLLENLWTKGEQQVFAAAELLSGAAYVHSQAALSLAKPILVYSAGANVRACLEATVRSIYVLCANKEDRHKRAFDYTNNLYGSEQEAMLTATREHSLLLERAGLSPDAFTQGIAHYATSVVNASRVAGNNERKSAINRRWSFQNLFEQIGGSQSGQNYMKILQLDYSLGSSAVHCGPSAFLSLKQVATGEVEGDLLTHGMTANVAGTIVTAAVYRNMCLESVVCNRDEWVEYNLMESDLRRRIDEYVLLCRKLCLRGNGAADCVRSNTSEAGGTDLPA